MTAVFATATDELVRWTALLDDLEALLELQREKLDAGFVDVDMSQLAFQPPPDMPPLPAQLESRARGLLHTVAALVNQARKLANDVRPTARVAQPRGNARSAATPHFDHRA